MRRALLQVGRRAFGTGVGNANFRQRLKTRQPLYGLYASYCVPDIVEMYAHHCGLDWLWLDMEHTAASLETMQRMLVAASGSGCAALVRAPWNDHVWIKRILDMGPDGIILPMVNTKAEAEAAVRACFFPPHGARSVGVTRGMGYGATMARHLATAHEELVVVCQVETGQAVDNAEQLAAVDRVDAFLIGPFDLSGSLGHLADIGHPTVQAAIRHVIEVCTRAGKPVGILAKDPADTRQWVGRGMSLVATGVDCVIFGNAVRQWVRDCREPPAS
eukprot:EG_transcript_20971